MDNICLNTIIDVDLNDVEAFIESEKFIQFLLNNTTDFGTAAFVLQSVHEAIQKGREN